MFTWSRKPERGGDGWGARGPGAARQSPLRASEDEPPAPRTDSLTRKAAPKAPGDPALGARAAGKRPGPRAALGVAAASATVGDFPGGGGALSLRAGSRAPVPGARCSGGGAGGDR